MMVLETLLADWFGDRVLYGLFVLGNYVLAALLAYNELLRSRTSQGSIAWLVALALVPFPTTLIYMVFGLKLFDRYAQGQTHSGRVLRRVRSAKTPLLDQPTTAEWPVLANASQLPFLLGNDAELLIDGKATFASLFAGIDAAKTTILAQFYIIKDDALGREFAERLMARARAGVKVFLLYDDVGCFWLPTSYKQRLRDAGVEVIGFNHRHRFLRLFGPTRINYRNHRKIVVVDGQQAWIGGLNVGDEYMGRDPKFGHWRDTHVRIAGPAALAATLSFREDWEWATGEQLNLSSTPIALKGKQSILVMPTGPADKIETCAIAFSEVIAQAKTRLWIVSPYFVPDIDMQTALYAASMRGVDVRILIPRKPDHLLVWLASTAHANRMINRGVHVHRYEDGFLHEKAILVDNKIAGIGTVNFDNRSFRINFEVTMWFTYRPMLRKIEKMLRADFEGAPEVTIEDRRRQPFVMRLLSDAARLFSPIL